MAAYDGGFGVYTTCILGHLSFMRCRVAYFGTMICLGEARGQCVPHSRTFNEDTPVTIAGTSSRNMRLI